ncbi:hypothetical protein B9Z65_5576 [Elsinoe australis]|uniref:Glycosyl transferase CAP10 domain-containing protein n=1 Tax=Elsinoe australis TaxID=40998 RepID=A0A2P7ZJK4_9PEZI|nr:hypothetical protein B9Z65_5576 [Elsinoe australis]
MIQQPTIRSRGRPVLWVLLVLLAVALLANRRTPSADTSRWLSTKWTKWTKHRSDRSIEWITTPDDPRTHPVKALHQQAVRKFEALIARQSKTLEAAVSEYKHRWSRNPPSGFEDWFAFAKQQNSTVIDEFNMISEAMQPLWSLRPQQIHQMVEEAASGPDIWTLEFKDGVVITPKDNWMGLEMGAFLGDLLTKIPNLKILNNPMDEPRVLVSSDQPPDHVQWSDGSMRPAWKAISAPCNSKAKYTKLRTTFPKAHGMTFVTNLDAASDVCQNPSFKGIHGFFMAPTTFVTTDSPVPILSQAAPSTFLDIIHPSTWYWDDGSTDSTDWDYDWDNKTNKLYWAGGTTGGWNLPLHRNQRTWHSQRHRFIDMTHQLTPGQSYGYLGQNAAGEWVRYDSKDFQSELYDTRFTGTAQCDEPVCAEMEEYYHIEGKVDERRAYNFRLIIDIDGNSFSGRYHRFLASKSCVLKQTVFREWHDERLVPWLHYVPISTGMEELPEVVRYLATTEEGQRIAEVIAEKGREAHDVSLRRVDAVIYMYRLFLEYARMSGEGRDGGMVSRDGT